MYKKVIFIICMVLLQGCISTKQISGKDKYIATNKHLAKICNHGFGNPRSCQLLSERYAQASTFGSKSPWESIYSTYALLGYKLECYRDNKTHSCLALADLYKSGDNRDPNQVRKAYEKACTDPSIRNNKVCIQINKKKKSMLQRKLLEDKRRQKRKKMIKQATPSDPCRGIDLMFDLHRAEADCRMKYRLGKIQNERACKLKLFRKIKLSRGCKNL